MPTKRSVARMIDRFFLGQLKALEEGGDGEEEQEDDVDAENEKDMCSEQATCAGNEENE